MTNEKPVAFWDTQKGKLVAAVPLSSERTCFEVPFIPLYRHPAPRPFIRLTKERELLTRAGLVIAQYRWSHPEDQVLHQLTHQITKALEENPQDELAPRPLIRLTDKEIQEILGPFAGDPIRGYTRKLFDEIQDKLEEKNK